MKKILVIVINILIFLLISSKICFVQALFVLEVWDQRNDRNILQLAFQPQEVFYLKTIHSLALTPYVHIYKVDEEGNIILSGAIFESGGVGFPVIGDGVLSIVDGKFRMDEINRFVGKLLFRVSPLSQETLCVSNAEIPLYKMVPEGTLVEIRVSKRRD